MIIFTDIDNTNKTPGIDRQWLPGDILYKDAEGVLNATNGKPYAICVAEGKYFDDNYVRFILIRHIEFELPWGKYESDKQVLKNHKIYDKCYFGCDIFEDTQSDIIFFNNTKLLYRKEATDETSLVSPFIPTFWDNVNDDDCINDKDGSIVNKKEDGEFVVIDNVEESAINYSQYHNEYGYLPSTYEWLCCAANLYKVNKLIHKYHGRPILPTDWYWTSTELDEYKSVIINFYTGKLEEQYKFDENPVRLFIKIQETYNN